MAVHDTNVIDFVAHEPTDDAVLLVMVEPRPWGRRGRLLPELQDKFNTYFLYATEGSLLSDFPDMAGKPITIELRCAEPPGERESSFLDIVERRHLAPAGIGFRWTIVSG